MVFKGERGGGKGNCRSCCCGLALKTEVLKIGAVNTVADNGRVYP